MRCCLWLHLSTVYFVCISLLSAHLMLSKTIYESVGNLSTTWINSPDVPINSSEYGLLSILLLTGSIGTKFLCGFYCKGNMTSNGCFFGILIGNTYMPSSYSLTQPPQLVWSPNGNRPVKGNASLEFTADGNLILRDADGSFVWSTNTGGRSVLGLKLTDMGNLVLFDRQHKSVWQSFDHPTDSLVLGQKLLNGQRLSAGFLYSNSSQGMHFLAVENGILVAYISSNPRQVYSYNDLTESYDFSGSTLDPRNISIRFENGSFAGFGYTPTTAAQFLRLDLDGHLRVYAGTGFQWQEVADLLPAFGDCGYPMVCGRYGICSNAQCSCFQPTNGDTSFFRPVNYLQPNHGCFLTNPVNCDYNQLHFLLELQNISYFDSESNLYGNNIKLEECKKACIKNCSCQAIVFSSEQWPKKNTRCSLLNEVFSLRDRESYETQSIFVKLQNASALNSPESKSRHVIIVVGSSLGALLGFLFLVGACFILLGKVMKFEKIEEICLDQVPGMLSRFSYDELRATTNNFTNKLGEGGFGSVFEGNLKTGEKVAVKRLDGLSLMKKSFLAEVETIRSIHHVNLVTLIGFCAEKSYRLLVYKYMHNGSLEKWIFHRNRENALGWRQRMKIILDVARGLTYLHEECRMKIVHLDIKPQNILLDENFDAKVSDFGLSKLIDKDQSQVVTTMRGTLGYMAPEWLSSVITEKVDVYSFGVMALEILCGRKNLDKSQPEDEMHLLCLLKQKAEADKLQDLIDKNSEDMQLHRAEVVKIMKVAIWCLQSDFTKRPSMSDVIRVLEGSMEVESNLAYNFTSPPVPRIVAGVAQNEDAVATPLLPLHLSGPR